MIIALADKLYSWGRGQRDFAIVTANEILDGLGTVGTKHADIGPTKAEEQLQFSSPPTLFYVMHCCLWECSSKLTKLSSLLQLSSVSCACFSFCIKEISFP